jgi:transglutaminase-like putative cysteine protease
MHIRYGYSIDIMCMQATPVIAMLDVHPSRRHDISQPDEPSLVAHATAERIKIGAPYRDEFDNICRRLVIPAGGARLQAEGVIQDSGFADPQHPELQATLPDALPSETLVYLIGSRYCETDRLSEIAWTRFGAIEGGWAKVQAICDFVHEHIRFDYNLARNTRTAFEAYEERVGVCRDFTHLAVTLCRAMNIPARYCTGYLGDIGVPPDPAPMDFSAWFEVWLEGRWWSFDARHNIPRIGRVVIARGRDAADVPIVNSFGPHWLGQFKVVTEEIAGARFPVTAADRRDHWSLQGFLGDRARSG